VQQAAVKEFDFRIDSIRRAVAPVDQPIMVQRRGE